jgi:hypothetical protein
MRSPRAETQIHSLYSDDLEPLMEVLTFFVAAGYQLLSVYLIDDDGKQTSLPIEAFDGSPISASMENLQMEFQKIACP